MLVKLILLFFAVAAGMTLIFGQNQKLNRKTADRIGNETSTWISKNLYEKHVKNKPECKRDESSRDKAMEIMGQYIRCVEESKQNWMKRSVDKSKEYSACCLKWTLVGKCYLNVIKRTCEMSVANNLDKILRNMKMDGCPNVGYVNDCNK